MKVVLGIVQIGLIHLFFLAGSYLSNRLHLMIPGSIVGLALLFTLLQLGIVKMQWVEWGANWLLAELLLFFVPSAVGIIKYPQVIGIEGIKMLLVVVTSTLVVMAVTGLLTEYLNSRSRKKGTV